MPHKRSELAEIDEVMTLIGCLLFAMGGAALFTGCYHVYVSQPLYCFSLSWAHEKLET